MDSLLFAYDLLFVLFVHVFDTDGAFVFVCLFGFRLVRCARLALVVRLMALVGFFAVLPPGGGVSLSADSDQRALPFGFLQP